jgi:hypothetical protein
VACTACERARSDVVDRRHLPLRPDEAFSSRPQGCRKEPAQKDMGQREIPRKTSSCPKPRRGRVEARPHDIPLAVSATAAPSELPSAAYPLDPTAPVIAATSSSHTRSEAEASAHAPARFGAQSDASLL